MRYGDPDAGPRARYGTPDEERFWLYVDKDGPGGCWLFGKGRTQDGYAQFQSHRPRPSNPAKGITVLAHRFAWELEYGKPPDGDLNHLCYRRNCVRVSHLEDIGHFDNVAHGNARRALERHAYRLLEDGLLRLCQLAVVCPA